MKKESDLRGYQLRTIQFLKDTPKALVFLDMGLGKTVSSLTAIRDLRDTLEVRRWLIVTTKNVALDTWPTEIDTEWEHIADITYAQACVASLKQRKAAIHANTDILIINQEKIAWLEQYLLELAKSKKQKFMPFDAILMDDAGIKDNSSRRWKVLRRLCRLVDRVVVMTGTPAPNSLAQIHPQVCLVDGGERLGESFNKFKDRHFYAVDNGGYKLRPRKGHSQIIYDAIADISLTMKSEDYITLPDRIDQKVRIHLPDKIHQQYKEFEVQYLLRITEESVVEAPSAAALSSKLLQMANGCVYENLEDGSRTSHHIHDCKIEALKQIIEDANGMPVMVAYAFQTDAERIMKAIPQAEVFGKRPDAVERWNRREIPVLLTHPKSAGHGLNLQFGGNIIVWFGLTYSLEQYLQLNKRLHRSGQKEQTVVIKHLVAEGTIDETVMSVLAGKNATQEALLAALKKYANQITTGAKT